MDNYLGAIAIVLSFIVACIALAYYLLQRKPENDIPCDPPQLSIPGADAETIKQVRKKVAKKKPKKKAVKKNATVRNRKR